MSESLPLFPLRTVLFPGMILPLHIFEQRYRKLIAERREVVPVLGVASIQSGFEVADEPKFHAIGTSANLIRLIPCRDGRCDITIHCERRFRVIESRWHEGLLVGQIELLPESPPPATERVNRLVERVKLAFESYLATLERVASVRIERAELGQDAVAATYAICASLPIGASQRQRLLEAPSPIARLEDLFVTLHRENELFSTLGVAGSGIETAGARFSRN